MVLYQIVVLQHNGCCTFFEYGSSAPSLGVGPAYHAYRYRLRIFNRNGENIRFISDCNPNGFVNGSIKWDGRDGYGNLVQGGVYVAQLTLWNCNTPEDGNMDFSILTASKKIVCDRYEWQWLGKGWILPTKECVEYHIEDLNSVSKKTTFF
jgi:hypothetical protein